MLQGPRRAWTLCLCGPRLHWDKAALTRLPCHGFHALYWAGRWQRFRAQTSDLGPERQREALARPKARAERAEKRKPLQPAIVPGPRQAGVAWPLCWCGAR